MDGLPLSACCRANGDLVLQGPDLTSAPGSGPLLRDVAGCPLKFNWAKQISENASFVRLEARGGGRPFAWGGCGQGKRWESWLGAPLVDLFNRGQTAAVADHWWSLGNCLSPLPHHYFWSGGPLVHWFKWGGVGTTDSLHLPTPPFLVPLL